MNQLLNIPDAGVTIRAATLDDIPFIDALQKMHSKMVGFMPNGQLVGKINAGDVLVAEVIVDRGGLMVEGESSSQPTTLDDQRSRTRVGYLIGTDRYFKHDDVGIIYHLNVVPGKQRSFVGAALLKAQFDRSAYGCRLYCCWCAQDIQANRFWEAMGFVPLAYRAGSEKKARVHIFWQKRIREGDRETPWWFPAKTDAGALRADRIVLPIPPGVRWSDEMPVILRTDVARASRPRLGSKENAGGTPTPRGGKAAIPAMRQFGGPMDDPGPQPVPEKSKQFVREKKPKVKADPKLVSAARELRDRWLEQVNAGQYVFEDAGKYDVSRALPASPVSSAPVAPMLPGPRASLPAA